MKFYFFILFFTFLFWADSAFSQEIKSVHKVHNELYGIDEYIPGRFDPSGKDIIPLNRNADRSLNGAVFGFLPDWEYGNGDYKWIDYNLVSHVACFDFVVGSSGSLSIPAYWPWTDLINEAHSKGVKVILTAVSFDKDDIRSVLTNSTAKQTLFTNIKNKISQYQLDGVNVDFESLYSADEGDPINEFMADLTAYIHLELPGKEVSFAGPSVNWNNSWKLGELAQSCDYIFIMGYSFYGSWSSSSGPGAPLTGGTYNITNTILNQYAQVTLSNPGKLILGVPYYGLHWTTSNQYAGSSTEDFIGSPRFSATENGMFFHGMQWSTDKNTPWYRWFDDDWHQVWADNDSSLGLKYDLAINNNLMGVGMWALGYDGARRELWDVIEAKFGNVFAQRPNPPAYFYTKPESFTSFRVYIEENEAASQYILYMSDDGVTYSDSVVSSSPEILVSGLTSGQSIYLQVKSKNSTGLSGPSETLAVITGDPGNNMLIVNGFDRTASANNNFDYIKKYIPALEGSGYTVSSASNEAVVHGEMSMIDYGNVIWISGIESTTMDALNLYEKDSLRSFLNSGGRLFISGAELGWDIGRPGYSSTDDLDFYNNYLKANYKDDAPIGSSGTYYLMQPYAGSFMEGLPNMTFDNGNHGTYDVEWPDAITPKNGSFYIAQFAGVLTSRYGGAGVAFDGVFPEGTIPGKVVYLTVPFETFYPDSVRKQIMTKVVEYFESPVSVDNAEEIIPDEFLLYNNYPNPFNPETTISFSLPEKGDVTLEIYNVLGEKISSQFLSGLEAGNNNIKWSPGSDQASGLCLYKVSWSGRQGIKETRTGKMIYMK